MNVIKFIGKVLALPIKVVMFVIALGLFPIKLLTNWLSGYGKYNRLYLTFSKMVVKHAIEAAKRGEKPVLENVLKYIDDYTFVKMYNNKKDPFITTSHRISTDEVGYNVEPEVIA